MAGRKTKIHEEIKNVRTSGIERFTIQAIHRSELKNAEYNPRVIDDQSRRKLKTGLAKLGLISPITWNKRTGNIVGGHQRCSIMDDLMGTQDYELNVAVVDLDEKQEQEANILLNNHRAQGQYDFDALGKMLSNDLDYLAAGFDNADMMRIFGADVLQKQTQALEEIANNVREKSEEYDKFVRTASADRDSEDYYMVVVFKNYAQRKMVTDALQLEDNKFQDGRWLATKLGVSLDAEDD